MAIVVAHEALDREVRVVRLEAQVGQRGPDDGLLLALLPLALDRDLQEL